MQKVFSAYISGKTSGYKCSGGRRLSTLLTLLRFFSKKALNSVESIWVSRVGENALFF